MNDNKRYIVIGRHRSNDNAELETDGYGRVYTYTLDKAVEWKKYKLEKDKIESNGEMYFEIIELDLED